MKLQEVVNKSKNQNEGKIWFEIVLTLTVSLNGFVGGMLLCWPSPFLVKIVNDDSYEITEEQASYFTVLSQIGIIILPPFLAPIANSFGRKKLILSAALPYIISFSIKAFCKQLWLLYFARLCSGFGDAIMYSCAIVYIGEVTSPKVRGIWGNCLIILGFLGQFFINVFGIYFSIQLTSFICLTVPIVFAIVFSFMPETPYFYIAKGRDEKAKETLRRLRRKNNIEEEFKQLKISVQDQLTETCTWMNILKSETNRKALLTGIYLRMAQLFSGIFPFMSYTLLIFQKSGTNISPEISSIIFTGLNFVCITCVVYSSSKLGRRKSLIFSKILTGIVLVGLGIYFLVEKIFVGVNLEGFRWIPLTGMIAFVVTSSFGLAIVPTLMLGEIFSVNGKSKGIALVTSCLGIMAFIVNNLFYYLNNYTGLCGPFLLFGMFNLVSAIVTYYVIPETNNKTLEEIQEQMRKL